MWQWHLDAPGAGLAGDRAVLSNAELARADAFLVADASRRFVAARARLRRTVAVACGGAPQDLALATGPKGKPFLPGGPEFNLSHSGGVALFALAGFPVGVDVEAVRPIEDGVARLVFTAAELLQLRQAPNQTTAFFRGWTRKEAVVKAQGGSLTDLPGFSVALGAVAGVMGDPSWQIVDLPAPSGHAAALAAPRLGWSVTWRGRESG